MRCFSCKDEIEDNSHVYFCKACLAASDTARAEEEAQSRTVDCPSCHAKAGQPCLTGSGAVRNSAHVTREDLVKKLLKKAAKEASR